jgi:hypothetical protein
MKDRIDEIMEANRPEQTTSARAAMFAHVMFQVATGHQETIAIKSPYTAWLEKSSSRVVAGVVGVCFIIATGGTVAASEKAKPGDVLFPVDQATEAVRLLLADNEQKAVLQLQFLDERQQELAAIVDEELAKAVREIATITNKESVTERGEARITRAVDEFLRQAEQLPKSDTEGRRQAVVALINGVRVHGREGDDVRLRIDDDRFEIETEDRRIRSREGEASAVRYNDNDDSDGDDDGGDTKHSGSSDGDDSNNRQTRSGSQEEADRDDESDAHKDKYNDRNDESADRDRHDDDKEDEGDHSGSGKDDDEEDANEAKETEDDHSDQSGSDDE